MDERFREFKEFREFKDKTTKELVLGFRLPRRGTRKNSPLRSSLLELQSGCGASASHTHYSRTRSEATKPPFSKRGFGGNVNIFL